MVLYRRPGLFFIPGGEKDPAAIVAAVAKNGMTTMHFVPSMLSMFLEYLEDPKELSKLSSFVRSLPAVSSTPQQANRFNRLLHAKHHTLSIIFTAPPRPPLMSPTFDCSAGPELATVPIGRPIDNIRLYMVDKHYNLQPIALPANFASPATDWPEVI